jgi:hypothetical protein
MSSGVILKDVEVFHRRDAARRQVGGLRQPAIIRAKADVGRRPEKAAAQKSMETRRSGMTIAIKEECLMIG